MKRFLNKTLATTLFSLAGLTLHNPAAHAALLPIRLHVVVHDEVHASLREHLEASYLKPWVQEMETVSGRQVELHFREGIPGLSDLDYLTPDRRLLLSALTRANETFWNRQGDGNWNYRLDKTLLLAPESVIPADPSESELLGEARARGTAGWASLKAYATAGHELGHMFGATHEDAEVLFNGWFCETYTYPVRRELRSNCYRYSDRNREAIRAYLSEVP